MTMKSHATKTFETLDLYLSAFLTSEGLQATLKTVNRRVVFSFPVTDGLYKLMSEFNGNALVPVYDLVTSIRQLKGKMLSAKDGILKGDEERNGNQEQQP